MTEAIPIQNIPDTDIQRTITGMPGFDEFLGGGLVPGTVILFAGEPGVGKSTLLLQIAYRMARVGKKVLYSSGEESLSQIKIRANRLGALDPNIYVSDTVELGSMEQMIQEINPDVLIVDSLQMAYNQSLPGMAGCKAQITACLNRLIEIARDQNKTVITVGHSTKNGTIAGMQTLQHMVDVTMYMYSAGGEHRRVFSKKNRYGPAQINWDILMKESGIIDPKEPVQKPTTRVISVTDIPDVEKPNQVTLPYATIQAISNQRWLDRTALKTEMDWLIKKAYGEQFLDRVKEYDIIYKLKD